MSSEAYGFYDDGETWYRQRGLLTSGTVGIASAGAGGRLAVFGDTNLQLEAARQLDVPPGFRHGWAFNLASRRLQ